jgi:hypothetical protein
MEQKVLLLIILPLPVFGFVYLYSQRRLFEIEVPELSWWWESFLLGIQTFLLLFQGYLFRTGIGRIHRQDLALEERVAVYGRKTLLRFWILFASAILSAAGLLLFDHAIFTVTFAITLVLLSLFKPAPDRVVRILKLKGEEKEAVMDLRRKG